MSGKTVDSVSRRESRLSAEESRADQAGRVISELVMAEIFLVQATIESATALGDRLGELRKRWSANDETGPSVGEVLRQTRREVVEPYAERLDIFRKLVDRDTDNKAA